MRIVVRPPSVVALHKLVGEQLARGGLYLPRDLQQPQFAAIDVVVECPATDDGGGERFVLACEVLQGFPGTATALNVKPAGRGALDALMAHAMTLAPAGADGPLVVDDDDDAAEDEEDAGEAVKDISLIQQVAAMSVAEKRQAAMHGSKDMRLILIKDSNKTIHPFVLQNPALGLEEVEAISRMTGVHPDVLHTIAKNWTRSPNVVRNLVKNPKTPLPDAVALIEKLALSDLRSIAKGGSVRMAILQAARRKVTGG